MRLIDADKLIENYAHYGISHYYDAADLEDIVNECPTACDMEQIRKDINSLTTTNSLVYGYEKIYKSDVMKVLDNYFKEE